jgi:hypothetical protein
VIEILTGCGGRAATAVVVGPQVLITRGLRRFLNARPGRQIEDRTAVVGEIQFVLVERDIDMVRQEEVRAQKHVRIDAERAAKSQFCMLHFLIANLEARKSAHVAFNNARADAANRTPVDYPGRFRIDTGSFRRPEREQRDTCASIKRDGYFCPV